MHALIIDLAISMAALALAIRFACKKRARITSHLPFVGLSVFWMLITVLRLFFESKPNQGWEQIFFTIIWYAILLVLGLCIMYGSKTIHFLGRDIIILVIAGVFVLFLFMILYS